MTKVIAADRLREVLAYDQITGAFTWRIAPNGRVKVGAVAGNVDKNTGYLRIGIDGRVYMAHHLAWAYMIGEAVPGQIDHRDLNRANNAWLNLRPSTQSQNAHNRRALSTSQSGVKGIAWHKRRQKWQASITQHGKQHHLGYFVCPLAAALAYWGESIARYGEFARSA